MKESIIKISIGVPVERVRIVIIIFQCLVVNQIQSNLIVKKEKKALIAFTNCVNKSIDCFYFLLFASFFSPAVKAPVMMGT